METGKNKPLDLTAEKRITYRTDDLRGEFDTHLDRLFARLKSKEVAATLGAEFARRVGAARKQLDERLRGSFRVVVMGDFKRGKSTLVNALLETAVATTNVTPETVTINEIAYGERLEAEICLGDSGRVAIALDEIAAESLVPLIENLVGREKKVSHLEIKAPVEWLKNASLIDTPGLGDVLNEFDAQVQAYLNKADAIVYLISAVSPLSETETDFLRLSIEPQEFPKIIFAVNMLDVAQTDENARRVLAHITGKITKLFPNAQIYGLSAFDEICRITGEPRPNAPLAPLLENNFEQFRATLQNSIVLDRNLIQLDRAGDLLRLTLADFDRSASTLAAALGEKQGEIAASVDKLTDSNSELKTRIAADKQNFLDEVKRLGEQAVGWTNEFLDRLERETIADLTEFSYDEVQRNFHFFLSDAVRDAVAQCDAAHRDSIIKAANDANAAMSREAQTASPLALESEMITAVDTKPEWSRLDAVGSVVSFLLPVGIFVELGSKLLFKESEEAEKLENYCRGLKEMLPDLRVKTAESLREGYGKIAEKIGKQLEAAFEKEKTTALAALKQAETLQQTGQTQTENATETLAELHRVFADSRRFVESLTEKLWTQTKALRDEAVQTQNSKPQNLTVGQNPLDLSASTSLSV